MKIFAFFFILFFLSNSIFAEKISTIKLSYLIENSMEYQSFIENLEIKKQSLFKSLQDFKGLKYRQQIIYKKNIVSF